MSSAQIMKQLHVLKIGNTKLIVRCAYSRLTKNVTIQNIREYDKHYTYSKSSLKKMPLYGVIKNVSTCDILKQHANELRDDPERLSTEFMQKMIGVECK